MFYQIVRPVARYVLRYYYRNIDITGLENIPKGAAVILAANHPTAFIEPCIMACFQPRTLWFLARGDLFKNKLAQFGLAAVNILPVFRLKDGGYGKLKENYGTFNACHEALSKRRAIMILAEGRCIHEKALRPLRKGAARLALGAMYKDPTLPEVYIVPVGVNFTHAARLRGTVMIRCGEPILASEYMESYRRGEAAAIKELTSHLRSRLNPLVVQFPSRELADVGEARLEADRSRHQTSLRYGVTHNGDQLDRELQLAASTTADDQPTRRQFRLQDNQISGKPTVKEQSELLLWLKAFIALILQLPILPLWALAEYLGLSKPKTVEFYSPVRFAVIAGGTFLIIPLALILLPWPLKVWLALTVVSVRWAIRQWEGLDRWREARRWVQLVPEERIILTKHQKQHADNYV
jgi:1-acyl-sn-glycerol-3-phosphate acyltransferase